MSEAGIAPAGTDVVWRLEAGILGAFHRSSIPMLNCGSLSPPLTQVAVDSPATAFGVGLGVVRWRFARDVLTAHGC